MNNFNNNPNNPNNPNKFGNPYNPNNPNNFGNPNNPNNFNNSNNLSNNLLNGFHRHQQNQIPFQQNALLSNNLTMNSNINYPQSNPNAHHFQTNQQQNMNQMQMLQRMKHIKQMHHVKRLEKLKEIENMDDSKIREYVIRPEQVTKNTEDKEKINANYNLLKNMYDSKESFDIGAKKFWTERTNEPYKNIIKDAEHYKQFLTEQKRKKLDNKDELIVHKVTKADRDEDILKEEWYEKEKGKKIHDDELKMTYSTSKQAEHKKKFEYNHIYKYRIKYDPSDHSKMKKNKIDCYKKEQEIREKDNKKVENIIEEILENDLLSTDQLKKLGINNVNNTVEIDMELLESQLKEQFGADVFNVDENNSEESNNNDSDNNDSDNDDSDDSDNESSDNDDSDDSDSDDSDNDDSDNDNSGNDDSGNDDSDSDDSDNDDSDNDDSNSDSSGYNNVAKNTTISSNIKTRIRIGKRKDV